MWGSDGNVEKRVLPILLKC